MLTVMTLDVTNTIRIEQTQRALESLRNEVEKWVTARKNKDKLRQYTTQLTDLQSILGRCIDNVRDSFKSVVPARSRNEVFTQCRVYDRRLLWIERLWSYFRTKFEQRDGPYAATLAAADEIVWSCYEQPFRVAGIAHLAVPLAY